MWYLDNVAARYPPLPPDFVVLIQKVIYEGRKLSTKAQRFPKMGGRIKVLLVIHTTKAEQKRVPTFTTFHPESTGIDESALNTPPACQFIH